MELSTKNKYKSQLIDGLKNKYDIEVTESSLNSILSPEEFIKLIYQYKPEDYSVGNYLSENYNDFFKNATDGKFRITLHNHTDFSDGYMTPEQFINQAAAYADKVAKFLPNSDLRPPFVIALTDHDEIKGSCEIIKIIAQNPQKYKNLKFVAGSEMGVKYDNKDFDLTALAINPFDEELDLYIENLKEIRTKTINEFINIVNNLDGSNYTLEYLREVGFKGKKTVTNGSGLIYIEDCKNVLLKLTRLKYGENSEIEDKIKKNYKENNYLYRDIMDIKYVLHQIKNNGGYASWTHPPRSFLKENNLGWHEEFFTMLKDFGVDGVEANQQYTYKHYTQDIKNLSEKNQLYRNLAQKYSMFLSGGTDSHETNIFAHHQILDDELVNNFLT